MATMRYTYDALGRRVSRTTTKTGLTEIMVGPRWQTLATYTAGMPTSTPREVFTYGDYIDEPLHRRQTTLSAAGAITGYTSHWYHRNQQYSVCGLTDSAGAIAELIRYTPYGEPTFLNGTGTVQTTSPTGNRVTYTGREYDAEAKSYYFRHRWYSAGLGRFVGRDPLMYPDGPNTYAGWFGVGSADWSGRACGGGAPGVSYIPGRGTFDKAILRLISPEALSSEGQRIPDDGFLQPDMVATWKHIPSAFYDANLCKCCCDSIGFVQIARTRYKMVGGSRDYGWMIDDGSILFDPGLPYPATTPSGSPCKPLPFADMTDRPWPFATHLEYLSWGNMNSGHQEFELCAVCLSGIEGIAGRKKDRSLTVYGCVSWSAYFSNDRLGKKQYLTLDSRFGSYPTPSTVAPTEPLIYSGAGNPPSAKFRDLVLTYP